MRSFPPPTARALADRVNEILGPPDAVTGRVGLMRCSGDDIEVEVIAVLNSVKDELPRVQRVSVEGAFLSATATCSRLVAGSLEESQPAGERVRVTIALTTDESAIVVASATWALRGECAIDHPIVAALREWAGLRQAG